MILIIMTNLQTDLGLGNPSYLLWADWFNLVQIFMLVAGLGIILYVHLTIQSGSPAQGYQVNFWSRIAITFFIYPFVTIGLILLGYRHQEAGAFFIAFGFIWGIVATVGLVQYSSRKRRKLSKKAADDLREQINAKADLRSTEVSAILERAFTLFDLDNSEMIDRSEMQMLMASLYPELSKRNLSLVVHKLRERFACVAAGEITLEDFVEMFEVVNSVKDEILPPGSEIDKSMSRGLMRMTTQTFGKSLGKITPTATQTA